MEKPQDGILEEFKIAVNAIFPDIGIWHSSSFNVNFGCMNSVLKDTWYFIDSNGQTYFHLTSYRNLFSIANSGMLRLYNLTNSDDANELSLYKDVGFTQEHIDTVKKNIFTLSCCQESDLDNKKLWEEYGKVAIVFEILSPPVKWEHFHLSKVFYEPNIAFRKYFELLEDFKIRLHPLSFSFDTLRDLIAFHKNKAFDWEQEVRLMYIAYGGNTNSRLDQYSDFKTSEHHTGETKYIELPLYFEPGRDMNPIVRRLKYNLPKGYYNTRPQLKIKRVILGDNEDFIDERKFTGLRTDIDNYLFQRFGYIIEVDRTLFRTGVKKVSLCRQVFRPDDARN